MRRRDFVALAGGAAMAWSLGAVAQQAGKRPSIGVLTAVQEPFWSQFREALRKLGYVEGGNIRFELRFAEGKPELLPGLAAELARLKVDLIVASLTPAIQAAKLATHEIPIVMAPAGDPVATGLIASLARPGGNITGVSGTVAGGKLIELVREIVPNAKRVAILANPTDPFTKVFVEQNQLGGRTLGIETPIFMIGGAHEYNAAFSEMDRTRVHAVIVQPSLLRKPPIELALKYRLPSASPYSTFAEAGGLMSFSASDDDLFGQPATYVDKILKGAKPADLPVQQPTKYELILNLKTAKALGLKIPQSALLRADRVIE